MIPIMHRKCGQTAFYALERPVQFTTIDRQNVRLLDGETIPSNATPMRCGACAEIINAQVEVYPEGGWADPPPETDE